MKKELELYIHIPFCVRKCAYCDFLSWAADEHEIERYVDALAQEIQAYEEALGETVYEVTTIFLGGGTPSLLSGEQIERIMQTVKRTFSVRDDAEITMEVNPGTVTKEQLARYRGAGVNRISFGLQSVHDEELRMLGRIHTFAQFKESYRLAREAGFQNINVDLISAIPGQTVASWERSLRTIVSLAPEHFSAYSLIIEEGTPFALLYGAGGAKESQLPTEEEEREMYRRTETILEESGYHRYEISNYAKKGRACRHNLGYWERKEYLGLGLGASSLLEETRFHNTTCMEAYLKDSGRPTLLRKEVEKLSIEEQMEEFVFLGLRKMEGISECEFARSFGKTIWDCYGDHLLHMMEQGLLVQEGEMLRLTRKGIDISNYVFAEILA